MATWVDLHGSRVGTTCRAPKIVTAWTTGVQQRATHLEYCAPADSVRSSQNEAACLYEPRPPSVAAKARTWMAASGALVMTTYGEQWYALDLSAQRSVGTLQTLYDVYLEGASSWRWRARRCPSKFLVLACLVASLPSH